MIVLEVFGLNKEPMKEFIFPENGKLEFTLLVSIPSLLTQWSL